MSNVELCIDRCMKIHLGDKYFETPEEVQLSILMRCISICVKNK
jgi:hypothetical protein